MMRWKIPLVLSALPLASLVVVASAAPPKPAARPSAEEAAFAKQVAPLVKKYCTACHNGKSGAGGIDLASDRTVAAMLKNRTTWERAIANVSGRTMPPTGSPQPTQTERDTIVGFVQSAFSKADCAIDDPGRVTMRRLNRVEYNNTVRDLLGVDLRVADDFPSDDVGYGFDNIGDVLTISPLLMEKYLGAARKIARTAIVAPEDRRALEVRKAGAELSGTSGGPQDAGFFFGSVGDAGFEYDFPGPGEYTITAEAWGQQAGPEVCKMRFFVGGEIVRVVDVPQRDGKAGRFTAKVQVDQPGKRRVAVGFANDFYDPKNPDPKNRDRNLMVESLAVTPPDGVTATGTLPESHRRLITTRPTDGTEAAWDRASAALLKPLARRAFRRPATAAEIQGLVRVTHLARSRKQSFERGMQLGVQAMLVSPHFLFRVELDPKPDNPKARRPLNDFERATRLSYLLWSSMPDETLLRAAEAGKLRTPAAVVAQARRMLKDPKAQALADNFAGQWLQLRKLAVVQPDTERFPDFNEKLRAAMGAETRMYFTNIVQNDRSILEFLDANYTFLNEPLARHYGIPGVTGDTMRRVALTGGQRGGLLGQASVLTLTSNPGRTSPVKRGKWVLENILGTPPPPPPPNVPQLPEEKKGEAALATTVRQRLEEHRKNPACNACHQRLDGIGFAMENFDAVGAWRVAEGGQTLDVSGELPDGSRFAGPKGLRQLLMKRKGQFVRAITERLLTYALGRGIESYDQCNIDAMAKTVAARGYRFSEVVAAVVTSKPFLERRGDEMGARKSAQGESPERPKAAAGTVRRAESAGKISNRKGRK